MSIRPYLSLIDRFLLQCDPGTWMRLGPPYVSCLIPGSRSTLFIGLGPSSETSNLAPRQPRNPLPPLAFRHRTAEGEITKLQTEKQALQAHLHYLRHHLALRKMHARSVNNEVERNRRMDSCYEDFRLLGERHRALVASHSASVRGSHVQEYQKLLTEHIHLEDKFRQVTAARIVARYQLQKLIIDTACHADSIPLHRPHLQVPLSVDTIGIRQATSPAPVRHYQVITRTCD